MTHQGTPAAVRSGIPSRKRRHPGSRADPLFDQAVGDELAVTVDDRAPIDPQPVGQRPLGRQAGALGQGAGQNLLAQALVELAIDGHDALAVDNEGLGSPSIRRH